MPGEVRVLEKGEENLFRFLDETTVANHDRSCASFSLTVSVKNFGDGKGETKKGKIFFLFRAPQESLYVL